MLFVSNIDLPREDQQIMAGVWEAHMLNLLLSLPSESR